MSLIACVRPALKIGIASSAATLVKRAAPEAEAIDLGAAAAEQRAEEEPREPLGLGLLPARIGGVELRLRGEQIRPALQQRRRLAGTRRRDDRLAARRRDARGVERLVADQHGDAMPRHGGERLERRYRRARSRRFGLRTLDVERRREAGALAGGDEAQRLVVRRRDRAHGFELAQRADEHEVVGGDIGQHQQAHAARAVLDGQSVGLGRCGARAQAAGEIDFPRNVDADRRQMSASGKHLPLGRVVAGVCDEVPPPTALMLGNSHERLIVSPARAARTRSAAILTSRFSRAARRIKSVSTGSP